MRKAASNTFTDGLIKDTNELASSAKSLSDALNATLVTYNGNEFVLQNDLGNTKVGQQAHLYKGYKPIGLTEFDGILYIASYNPETKRGQLGSFPSPEISYKKLEIDPTSISINPFYEFGNPPKIIAHEYYIDLLGTELNPGDLFLIAIDKNKLSDEFKYVLDNGYLKFKFYASSEEYKESLPSYSVKFYDDISQIKDTDYMEYTGTKGASLQLKLVYKLFLNFNLIREWNNQNLTFKGISTYIDGSKNNNCLFKVNSDQYIGDRYTLEGNYLKYEISPIDNKDDLWLGYDPSLNERGRINIDNIIKYNGISDFITKCTKDTLTINFSFDNINHKDIKGISLNFINLSEFYKKYDSDIWDPEYYYENPSPQVSARYEIFKDNYNTNYHINIPLDTVWHAKNAEEIYSSKLSYGNIYLCRIGLISDTNLYRDEETLTLEYVYCNEFYNDINTDDILQHRDNNIRFDVLDKPVINISNNLSREDKFYRNKNWLVSENISEEFESDDFIIIPEDEYYSYKAEAELTYNGSIEFESSYDINLIGNHFPNLKINSSEYNLEYLKNIPEIHKDSIENIENASDISIKIKNLRLYRQLKADASDPKYIETYIEALYPAYDSGTFDDRISENLPAYRYSEEGKLTPVEVTKTGDLIETGESFSVNGNNIIENKVIRFVAGLLPIQIGYNNNNYVRNIAYNGDDLTQVVKGHYAYPFGATSIDYYKKYKKLILDAYCTKYPNTENNLSKDIVPFPMRGYISDLDSLNNNWICPIWKDSDGRYCVVNLLSKIRNTSVDKILKNLLSQLYIAKYKISGITYKYPINIISDDGLFTNLKINIDFEVNPNTYYNGMDLEKIIGNIPEHDNIINILPKLKYQKYNDLINLEFGDDFSYKNLLDTADTDLSKFNTFRTFPKQLNDIKTGSAFKFKNDDVVDLNYIRSHIYLAEDQNYSGTSLKLIKSIAGNNDEGDIIMSILGIKTNMINPNKWFVPNDNPNERVSNNNQIVLKARTNYGTINPFIQEPYTNDLLWLGEYNAEDESGKIGLTEFFRYEPYVYFGTYSSFFCTSDRYITLDGATENSTEIVEDNSEHNDDLEHGMDNEDEGHHN